jgi:hypothetical protein
MRRSDVTSPRIVGVALLAGLCALACNGDVNDTTAAGGSAAAGGTTSVETGTGGTRPAGTTSTVKTGGTTSAGGTSPTGNGSSPASATSSNTGGAPGTSTGGTVSVTSTTSTAPHTGGAAAGGSDTGVGGVNAGGTFAAGGAGGTGGQTGDAGPTDAGSICATEGCMTLYVPFTAGGQATQFYVDFGISLGVNLSSVVATARVYVDTDTTDGSVRLFAMDLSSKRIYGDWAAGSFTTLDGGWHEITLDLSSPSESDAGANFNNKNVPWVGFNVASGTSTGATFAPATVYVDWLKFTPSPSIDRTFDGNSHDYFRVDTTYQAVPGSGLNGNFIPN